MFKKSLLMITLLFSTGVILSDVNNEESNLEVMENNLKTKISILSKMGKLPKATIKEVKKASLFGLTKRIFTESIPMFVEVAGTYGNVIKNFGKSAGVKNQEWVKKLVNTVNGEVGEGANKIKVGYENNPYYCALVCISHLNKLFSNIKKAYNGSPVEAIWNAASDEFDVTNVQ